ncbi:WD40 repeat [Dillenia turbinata]|uniref:RING-type E3 ubiquitin transferase n=1 Tax=Dillenia turbinata TaxID=194707 RepID=A0AAN8W096_9MAGN
MANQIEFGRMVTSKRWLIGAKLCKIVSELRLFIAVFNMAGKFASTMGQQDTVRFLINTVGSFVQDRLINKEQRTQHKEQCAERLAAEDGSEGKFVEVRYSDQAVLANLDWGIDALEEAIDTSNIETKLARLEYAEKMLQVCAMLNSDDKTAGVPNFYLSAWAHLNLSYLWKLRNDVQTSVLHVLEMFIIDPFFSRIDFAPELWKVLFLPHMNSIVGWYSEARQRIVLEVIPDSADLSITVDLYQFFNESLIFSMRPDQQEKMQKLEKLYGESLNENTRLYAKYFKDCLDSDASTSKKVAPMLPIAEPPMTPLHEISRSIPDYVKFGPILPKSAGLFPVLKARDHAREDFRSNIMSTSSPIWEESAAWDFQEGDNVHGETEEDSDFEPDDNCTDPKECSAKFISLNSMKIGANMESGHKAGSPQVRSRLHYPTAFSSVESPTSPSPKLHFPNLENQRKREPASVLRLFSTRLTDPAISSLPESPLQPNDFSTLMVDSDGEVIERQRRPMTNSRHAWSMSYGIANQQLPDQSSPFSGSDEGSQSCISLSMSEKLNPPSRPPKDFVCPITGQIFGDPVTLETGQTYERKAIQEWLERGNTTCPITRQPLSATTLPKTNYVLKRLITSWKEQHPNPALEFSCSDTPRSSLSTPPSAKEVPPTSTTSRTFNLSTHISAEDNVYQRSIRFMRPPKSMSPKSVITQAALETVINNLNPYITTLSSSEDLQECEVAVSMITRIWKESKGDPGLRSYLSKPTVINGFVEILPASRNREVLRMSICMLSELISGDECIGETLTSVDSDFDCLAALLGNGLAEAAVLIFQLRPTFAQLSEHDLISTLLQLVQNKSEETDDLQLIMEPKDAAVALLEQILTGGDENSKSVNAMTVISANGIAALVKCLDRVEARQSVVNILLCCIHADRSCRNLIANRIELSPVLELFHSGNDSVRGICIEFLLQLVQLNRRTLCYKILKMIKDEGAFSSMHAFLVYLQMAPMEQKPAIASLLLQLDLLVEPRKMSIYREETIDALIEALVRKDFPNSQLMALEALSALTGRVTASGKSYIEARLLKIAGFDQQCNALVESERQKISESESKELMDEEDRAASSWEKRVAFVFCNHEKGSVFKALEECLKSSSLEIVKSCLVITTWLVFMLYYLPDTGTRDVARKSLLEHFIDVLLSSRNLVEKVLATIALRSFVCDSGALQELGPYAKSIYKTLRKLKINSAVVSDILKAIMNLPSVNATELWSCTEVIVFDSSANGDILALLHLKGRILSSHSDGTIKVWDAVKRVPKLIQELRAHTRAVTCLCVPTSGDTLYTGSLDKTIRVWSIKPEKIQCLEVHDVKEPVYELTANAKIACFSSQGTGIRVYRWSGVPKHVNFNKNVKCLAMANDKLFCGCTGYSIQEVDLCTYTSSLFYSGTRKLLGKQSILSLCIRDGLLYAAGSVDGAAGKVFSLSNKAIVGLLSTGFDIQRITVNNEFIFAATKLGVIEVWLRERITRVASVKLPGNAKITSITSDSNGEMLFAATSDGKIQNRGYGSRSYGHL